MDEKSESVEPASARARENRRLLRAIMLAVLAWGGALSLGTFLFGIDQERGGVHFAPNPVRGLIMLSFVLGFLGCWLLLLRRRR